MDYYSRYRGPIIGPQRKMFISLLFFLIIVEIVPIFLVSLDYWKFWKNPKRISSHGMDWNKNAM